MSRGPARRRLDIPHQSPAEDRLLAMIAALTAQLAVTRERLDTVERLLESSGALDRAAIDAYAAPAEAQAERDGLRRRLIATIFRPIRDAAASARDEQAS